MSKGRGQPVKLNKEKTDLLVKFIGGGNYNVTACKAVGISESSFYSYLVEGEEDLVKYNEGKIKKPTIYMEFLEAIKKAEAIREAKWVKDIDKDVSWQSKAWLLERKYPKRWGRVDRHELTGRDGGPISFEERVKLIKEDREPEENIVDEKRKSLNMAKIDSKSMESKSFLDSLKDE